MKSTKPLPYQDKLKKYGQKGKLLHREDIYGSGPPSSLVSEEMLEYIIKHSGNDVLDIGCGIGAYCQRLQNIGFNCIGIENNPEYVKLTNKNGVKAMHMNAKNLKFDHNSFDTVIMVEVLEHIYQIHKVLDEVKKVIKKNLIISCPNIGILPYLSNYLVVPWHILEATHVNFFTKEILYKVLKKHFKKVVVEEYGQFANWVTEKPLYYQLKARALI